MSRQVNHRGGAPLFGDRLEHRLELRPFPDVGLEPGDVRMRLDPAAPLRPTNPDAPVMIKPGSVIWFARSRVHAAGGPASEL